MTFNLRRTHDRRNGFDAFLLAVALIGIMVAWYAFRAEGAWNVLGICALAGEALLAYGIFIEPSRLRVQRYRLGLVRNPTTWVHIVFLSDLHAGAFHSVSRYERIAHEAAALDPDLVLLGGDYVVDLADPVQDLTPLRRIQAKYGRYFVMGNHDMTDRPQEIRRALSAFGYEDLSNRAVPIEAHGARFELCGLADCWHEKVVFHTRTSLELPHVTLSHEPDVLLDMKEGDTDLVLIGHTHGGQVRLPPVGTLWPMPTKIGQALDRGKKIVHGIPCIVSNGLGEAEGRLRLWSPPEIVLVEIGI